MTSMLQDIDPMILFFGTVLSLDLIFMSLDYMTVKVPSRPCIQRFSIVKGR